MVESPQKKDKTKSHPAQQEKQRGSRLQQSLPSQEPKDATDVDMDIDMEEEQVWEGGGVGQRMAEGR